MRFNQLQLKREKEKPISRFSLRFQNNNAWICLSMIWVFSAFLVTWWCVSKNDQTLYGNVDGEFFSWHFKSLVEWSGMFDVLTLNPFQGMVSTYIPYSPWWNPGALVLALPFDTDINYILSYSIYFIELTVSFFLLARVLGLTKIESALASQLFVLFIFPGFRYFLPQQPHYFLEIAPFHAHLLALCNMLVFFYSKLGRKKTALNLALIFLLLFCSFSFFMSASFLALFYAPVYGLICLSLTFHPFNKISIAWKLGAAVLFFLSLLILELPDFYQQMGAYHMRGAFSDKLITLNLSNLNKLTFSYIVSHSNILSPTKNAISFFYFLSSIGGCIGLFWRSGKYRWAAIPFCFIFIATDVLEVFYAGNVLGGRISALNSYYFLFAGYSFYIVFFVIAILYLSNKITETCNYEFSQYKPILLIIFPLMTSYFAYSKILKSPPKLAENKRLPSIDYLINKISIKPGDRFQGTVASYFASPGSSIRERITNNEEDDTFNDRHYINAYGYLKRRYNNMHIFSDLWKYNIPTLDEYSHMITVPMYVFYNNLLGSKSRSHYFLHVYEIDLRILSALGVRFILTDKILKQPGISKILEQKIDNFDTFIDYGAVKLSKKIFNDLLTHEQFSLLSKNNSFQIGQKELTNEFRKRLDLYSINESSKVLPGLNAAIKIICKKNALLSLSDLEKIKDPFYGYLSCYESPPLLYLYEIEKPNLGTFSPTQPIKLHLANEILSHMQNPDFSFEKSIIIQEEDIPESLVPAKTSVISFEPNRVRIQAESDGFSILLLPIQYSNCLQITSSKSNASVKNVRLFRANLIQSAILFKDKIDIKLQLKYNSKCKSKDIEFCNKSQCMKAILVQ